MSSTHDTYADEPIDWKEERKNAIVVIMRYVPGADPLILAQWPTYFLFRMGTATSSWWDTRCRPECRWDNICYHADREGLPVGEWRLSI